MKRISVLTGFLGFLGLWLLAATGSAFAVCPSTATDCPSPTYNTVTLAADPTASLQAATKNYVDTHGGGGGGITALTGPVTASGSGSVATTVTLSGGGIAGALPATNGGTGVNNGSNTISTSLPFAITGSGAQTFFFGNTGVPWTYNFPQVSGNLAYQVGAIATGHCLQASGTAGGIADAGAVCGSGGTGITQLTGGVTAGPGSGSQVATVTAAPLSAITGLGTGVPAALAINVGSAGAPVTNGGALGTPSSGVGTNLTGTAASLTAGVATAANGIKTATTTVSVSAATAPTSGQVLTATGSAAATWQTPSGGGSVSITSLTPNIVVAPSPITGTGTISSVVPLNTQSGASYAILTTDNTQLIEMTNASATTMTIPVANSTGFLSGWGTSIVPTLAVTTITPASGTICGLSSISIQPGQYLSLGAGASTDYACALGLPATVPSGTIASGKNLGYDSSNRLVTATIAGGGNVSNSGTPTANQIATWVDATHVQGVTTGTNVVTALGNNLSAAGGVTSTIASGTSAMGTGAISSAACATVVTTTATGVATTDVLTWGFNGDPTGVTGYTPVTTGALTIFAYPSSGNANFKVCNLSSASITPGAITLNWRVVR